MDCILLLSSLPRLKSWVVFFAIPTTEVVGYLIWGALPYGLRSYPLDLPGNSGKENERLQQPCGSKAQVHEGITLSNPSMVIPHE